MKILSYAAMNLVAFSGALNAQIYNYPSGLQYDPEQKAIVYRGDITEEFEQDFLTVLSSFDVLHVDLASPGGLFSSGLNVGYALREYQDENRVAVTFHVAENAFCNSSCGIISLAAYNIRMWDNSTIKFHGPFYVDFNLNMTLQDIAIESGRMYTEMAMYLEYMGYTQIFAADIAYNTDACTMMVMDQPSEIHQYHFDWEGEFDPSGIELISYC